MRRYLRANRRRLGSSWFLPTPVVLIRRLARCPARAVRKSSVAGRAALVGVATGIARLAAGPGRCPARGEGMPGEGGAGEVVGEVVAVNLAGGLVQPERVQRPAVVGELGHAAGAVDHAEHTGDAAGGTQGGACGDAHREPEAQAATGARDLAAGLLLRRVERLPGSVDQDGTDTRQLPDGNHRAATSCRPLRRASPACPGTATCPGAPTGRYQAGRRDRGKAARPGVAGHLANPGPNGITVPRAADGGAEFARHDLFLPLCLLTRSPCTTQAAPAVFNRQG